MSEVKKIHPFEESGLGLAPFQYRGMSENAMRFPDGSSKAGGSCDHCGAGIRYEFHIESSDGKRFKVGSDCVHKLGSADNRLMSAVDREIAKLNAAKRQAKRVAKWEAQRQARVAKDQAERAANGGKLLAELAEIERKRLAAELVAKYSAENDWLIKVLDGNGDFELSMVEKLQAGPISAFSDRMLSVMADIYAKRLGGRRSSRAYSAAEDEFNKKAGRFQESSDPNLES